VGALHIVGLLFIEQSYQPEAAMQAENMIRLRELRYGQRFRTVEGRLGIRDWETATHGLIETLLYSKKKKVWYPVYMDGSDYVYLPEGSSPAS
jgi:hypothetical protein